MKLICSIFLAAALLLAIGCEESTSASQPSPTPQPRIAVAVIAKENPVEARHQLTWNGIEAKSQTVYYLILENGHKCEVDVVTWSRTKIGEKSTCE